MFIKSIEIKNFRGFRFDKEVKIENLNIPDGNEGSGLNIFVGENGCGKSTLLDAFALPCVSYKTDNFSINDINNPEEKTIIKVFSNENFEYSGSMPNANYIAKGFSFTGGLRNRRNKNYLSSLIVTDQKFLKADGEEKPKDNSPDLRLSVNNPWSGPRFNENEFLILDRNRIFQTKKGTYNSTRFDRLMDDFDYQYLKLNDAPFDYSPLVRELSGVNNEFVNEAIKKFLEISNYHLDLNLLDNWKPHANGFFGIQKDNNQIIPLASLGSGYEMIFALLNSFYLAQQSQKQLIILIDEPELHLHPRLQLNFVELILEISKSAQVILASHSPLLVKQAMENKEVSVKILSQDEDEIKVDNTELAVLPYNSANEIKYIAFGLASEEYHNELYEQLKGKHSPKQGIKEFDIDFFQNVIGEPNESPWKGNPNEVSRHTFIRNQIHHREENGKTKYEVLLESTKKMRSLF